MQFKLESTVLFDFSCFKVKRPIYLPFEEDESLSETLFPLHLSHIAGHVWHPWFVRALPGGSQLISEETQGYASAAFPRSESGLPW